MGTPPPEQDNRRPAHDCCDAREARRRGRSGVDLVARLALHVCERLERRRQTVQHRQAWIASCRPLTVVTGRSACGALVQAARRPTGDSHDSLLC